MDHAAILARLDEERRSLIREDDVTEIGERVTVRRSSDSRRCSVDFSRLSESDVDAAIAWVLRTYPFESLEWKLYSHDAPADLVARLTSHGLVAGPREAVMVLDIDGSKKWDVTADVRQVSSEATLADFRQVAEAVFAKDYSLTTGELRAALRAGSTEHVAFVAYAEGVPASIGRVYTHKESAFAGLYGGGTLPIFRGKGLYRQTVAARAQHAIACGAQYLLVDALPTSQPILERLGFSRIAWTWPFQRGEP